MCEVKLIKKYSGKEFMKLLALEKTLDRRAKAKGMRWYGHVLRKNIDDVVRIALDFKVAGRRMRGRPKMSWRRQVVRRKRLD